MCSINRWVNTLCFFVFFFCFKFYMDLQPVWKPLLDLYVVCVSLPTGHMDVPQCCPLLSQTGQSCTGIPCRNHGRRSSKRPADGLQGPVRNYSWIICSFIYSYCLLFTVFPPVLSGTEVCMGECGDGPGRLSRGHLRRAGAAHQWRRGPGFPAVLLPHTGTDDTHIKTVHMCQQNIIRVSSVTQDLEMFREGRGSEVVWGVADYWVSRVTWDPTEQQYHIKGKQWHQGYYR